MLISKIKMYLIKKKYNRMLDEQYKREKEMRERALNFKLEEIDRRLERSDATLNYYHSIFKK